MLFYPCACCGYITISDEHDICPICRWQHDVVQESEPYDEGGGANKATLKQGQVNFVRLGACELSQVQHARKVTTSDKRGPDWKPLP